MRPGALIAILVALVAVSCGESTEGKFGGELFEISCSGCHGSRGEGGTIARAIAGPGAPALDLRDDQIAGVIRVGPGAMPANSRLTDEQVDSLVEFLRSLQEPFR